MNTVNSLSGGDITKFDDVMNMPYSTVLVKLMINQEQARFDKRYAELLKRQSGGG